jgi:hypothetical protein
MLLRLSSLAIAAWLVAPRALAAEVGPDSGPFSVEVHAFAGQGFIVTTSNNYLNPDTKHGSFQLSDVGINFTKNLGDKLRVGIQLFAQYFGPAGNYNARADWFYLDYRFKDWLGFRAGRVKIPFGLYNEYNDIDSARIPILLPQSVYPAQARNYLLAQTGGELYGYVRLGSGGGLDCRLYAGTIFLDPNSFGSGTQVQGLTVPYLVGGRVLWETPVDGLRLGGSVQALRLNAQLLDPMMMPVTAQLPAILWVGSVEYWAHDLLLAAEYSRWHLKLDSNDPMYRSPWVANERAYGMVGYRANKWLQPSIYYALLFPNVDKREDRANLQHDIAATLRFDINANWLLKLEGHFMIGTAGLTPTLNDERPLSALDKYWAVFLAKTTAYF